MPTRKTTAATPQVRVQERWNGLVLETTDDSFVARLWKRTGDATTDEKAEFDLEEVSLEDRSLVRAGARFYWSVGYRDETGEQRFRFRFRFQRLVAFSDEEIAAARKATEKTKRLLNW